MSEINNIDMFKNDVRFRENIAHIETIPAKKASFKKVDDLNEKIVEYLDSKDIKLYEHQSETYEAIKNGENVIITTPTASGKTLAFNLPIMETMVDDKDATALYIYPAKALSNDQLHVLENLEKELHHAHDYQHLKLQIHYYLQKDMVTELNHHDQLHFQYELPLILH